MEKFLEPIELDDAELEAVAGGINNVTVTLNQVGAVAGNNSFNELEQQLGLVNISDG